MMTNGLSRKASRPPRVLFAATICMISVVIRLQAASTMPPQLGMTETSLTVKQLGIGAFDDVVVLKWFRVDDFIGDHDGPPDTNETFDVYFSISNKSTANLSNLTGRILTSDPRIDCILTPVVFVGALPGGTDLDVLGAFRLHVHPRAERGGSAVTCQSPGAPGTCSNFVNVPGGCSTDADCRRGVFDDYGIDLAVVFSSDQFAEQARPQSIRLDLDLDSQQPSVASATFVEGFEAGLSGLVYQNFDEGKASNALSDPYRCQYSVPSPDSSGECWLGSTLGQDPGNDWHIHDTFQADGGRAYLGVNSLHYGRHLGNPALDTYSFSQMDAIRTKSNINLAARVCRNDPSPNHATCRLDSDCATVGGGPCVSASPELSFAHQVSLGDGRIFGAARNEALDRAIVQVLVAGTSNWITVAPFENIFDVKATAGYVNCMFDPIDDGSNYGNVYPGGNPAFPLGPSSTCFPQYVFAYLGDTDEPFNAAKIGRASDGPGLPGALGVGTWVRSRFDLSPFRGRAIKLRFLLTSIDAGNGGTYQDTFHWYAEPFDDGWYIDDVRITQTLGAASPTVSLDTANNDALPGNSDGDAMGDSCDCAPADASAFAIPGEIQGVEFEADKRTIHWASAVSTAGSGTTHEVLRGSLHEFPVGSGASEACVASNLGSSSTTDNQFPTLGTGFWYLVRGRNTCGQGTAGFRSNGTERLSGACP